MIIFYHIYFDMTSEVNIAALSGEKNMAALYDSSSSAPAVAETDNNSLAVNKSRPVYFEGVNPSFILPQLLELKARSYWSKGILETYTK